MTAFLIFVMSNFLDILFWKFGHFVLPIIHLLNKQQLIEFYLDKQSYTLIGRIISIDNKVIKVNLVDTQSSFLKKEKISYNKIRVLAINTDYVDALEWYSKHPIQ